MTIQQVEYPRIPLAKRKPGSGNWERTGWLFMRISGVVLIVLIFGHLIINLVLGQGVHAIDFAFVAGKWASPFWKIWDGLMLVLAMLHGTNGMRTIINDYVYKAGPRKALMVTLWIACAVEIVLGLLVVFTFDPCPAGAAADLLPSFCPAR